VAEKPMAAGWSALSAERPASLVQEELPPPRQHPTGAIAFSWAGPLPVGPQWPQQTAPPHALAGAAAAARLKPNRATSRTQVA